MVALLFNRQLCYDDTLGVQFGSIVRLFVIFGDVGRRVLRLNCYIVYYYARDIIDNRVFWDDACIGGGDGV